MAEGPPPIDRGWDAVVAWANAIGRLLPDELERDPDSQRLKALRDLVGAIAQVKAAAQQVEATLRARELKDGIPAALAVGELAPDDLVALPLWHAVELARLAWRVASARTFDADDAKSTRERMRSLRAGVAVRESAETEAFMRHHGIRDAGRLVRDASAATATIGDAELDAQDDLLAFCRYVSPGFRTVPHLRKIADALERVANGELKRLIICMPPRWGKSFTVSQHFPAWYVGKYPDRKVIATSCTTELAEDFGRAVRNVVQQSEFERVFPQARIADDSQSAKRFHMNKGGVYYAVGMGGTLTGRGAHILIIDDPVKNREDADSDAMRRKHREWYTSTSRTRLMPGGSVVVVQTRWREDDLAGWLLDEKKHEGWEVISLSAVAEEPETHVLGDGTVWSRATGDPLDAERYREVMTADLRERRWKPQNTPDGEDPIREYALVDLEQTRRSSGSRDWSALYQQRPVPAEGGRVQLSWFKRFRADRPPSEVQRVVLSFDTGQKDKADNDPTVCTVWLETPQGHYLVDIWRDRVIYPALRRHALRLIAQYNPHAVLIEDKGNGTTLIQDLLTPQPNGDTPKGIPVIAIMPDGDKVTRWDRCSPMLESGWVYVPDRDADPPAWLSPFEHELSSFPLGKHDDQVDSVSQYLNWARERRTSGVGAAWLQPTSAQGSLLQALQPAWSRGRGGGFGARRPVRILS